jgi:hypothetical protein
MSDDESYKDEGSSKLALAEGNAAGDGSAGETRADDAGKSAMTKLFQLW